jgi:lipopolysaccharide biosynthesis regulator YciM
LPRISRKELKKDEFATEVSKTYEFLQQQRKRLTRLGIVAAAVALVAASGYFLAQRRSASANDQLAEALKVYYPLSGDITYADDKARYSEAQRRFAIVADKYSWVKPGLIARYYEGLSARNAGKTDEAIRLLQVVARSRDQHYSSLAQFTLAGVYAQAGRTGEAENLYRQLSRKPTDTVPGETASLALADLLSATKPAEAEKIYLELKKQAPKSVAAEQAEKRLAELKK